MITTPDYDALVTELGDPTYTCTELDEALDALQLPEIDEAHLHRTKE